MPVGESCEHVFLGPVPGRGSRAAISEAARAGVCHLNRSQPGWRKNRSFVSSPWGWLRGVLLRLGWAGGGVTSPLSAQGLRWLAELLTAWIYAASVSSSAHARNHASGVSGEL